MLRICIRRATAFVFLSVVFFSLAAPAQDLKLIGELADRGAWKEAYALSSRMTRIATADSRFSESALRQILVLNSALNQASNSRQYGAAWEQLGRYDKALKYYEATLTTDSSKVWPLAHNGGRIAAQQGDWAQVAYFYRMLEKQTTGWTAEQGKARAELADRYRQNPDDPDRLIELANQFWVTSIPAIGTDYPAALACLKRALDLNPDKQKRTEIYRHALDYVGHTKDAATIQNWRDQAANETESAANLVAEFSVALGNEALLRDDLDQARRHFSTVVQNMTDTRAWPNAVFNLGQCLQRQGSYQQAISTYRVLLKKRVEIRSLADTMSLTHLNLQHNACASLSLCYESILDFQNALRFHDMSSNEFRIRSFCGTCARSIAQQHKLRRKLLETLASLKTPNEDVIVRLCVNHCRQTGLLSKAMATRFSKQIGRHLFLALIGQTNDSQTNDKRIELLGMLRVTGLSGATAADWSRLFRTASTDTQFATVSLLYNTPDISKPVASVLSDQFVIAVETGHRTVANAIGQALTNSGADALEALIRQLGHPHAKVRQATRSRCRGIRDVSRHPQVAAALLNELSKLPLPEQLQCVYLINGFQLRPQDASLIAEALQNETGLPELRMLLDKLCGPHNKQLIDWKSTLQLSPLMLAVACGEIANIEQLARTDNVNAVDYRGNTALIRAVLEWDSSNTEVLAALIRGGVPLDGRGNRQTTALLEAVRAHNTAGVKMLLAAGADPNLKDRSGYSALRIALSKGYPLLAETILDFPVDLNTNYGNNRTALIEFCRINDAALVRRALELNASVNAVDGEKKSALIWAVKSNPSSTVIPKILLDRGAIPTMKDHSGKSAADYAQSPALSSLLNGQ